MNKSLFDFIENNKTVSEKTEQTFLFPKEVDAPKVENKTIKNIIVNGKIYEVSIE